MNWIPQPQPPLPRVAVAPAPSRMHREASPTLPPFGRFPFWRSVSSPLSRLGMLSRRSLGLVGLVSLGWALGAAAPAWAGFQPPDRGYPDDAMTQGGGTRSPNSLCVSKPDLNPALTLTPLVPQHAMALTAEAYPRFFWLMPENTAQYGEFSLFSVTKDGSKTWDDTLLYQTEFQPDPQGGMASLKLPDSLGLPPLEPGKAYRWYVTLLCDADNPLENLTLGGWIERSSLSPIVTLDIHQAQGRDRVSLLSQAGLWFDTVEALALWQCQDPDNPGIRQLWSELLQHQAVDLGNLAHQPLPPLCDASLDPALAHPRSPAQPLAQRQP